jgi:hypothetical protein
MTTQTVSTVLVTKTTVVPCSEASTSSILAQAVPISSPTIAAPMAPTTSSAPPPYGSKNSSAGYASVTAHGANGSSSGYAGPIVTGGAARAKFRSEYETAAIVKLGIVAVAVLAGAWML